MESLEITKSDHTIKRSYFHFNMRESMPSSIKENAIHVVVLMIEMYIRATLVPPATSTRAMLTGSCTINTLGSRKKIQPSWSRTECGPD